MSSFVFNTTRVLCKTSAADLKIFQFSQVVDVLSVRAPAFSSILEASVKRYRNQHTRNKIIPSIGFAAAILLRERNNLMCAAQCVNSMLFHQGHASKMVLSVYSCTVRLHNNNVLICSAWECACHIAVLYMLWTNWEKILIDTFFFERKILRKCYFLSR